jgi:cytochrome c553
MKTFTAAVAVAMFLAIGRATAGQQSEPQAPVAPRLTGAPGAATAPGWLSQTGLYSNVATLKVDPRNRRFSPQYPLWSDGATKRRWVQLPEGSQINVAELGKWELPVGTKFWKEFSFNGRKVETRFLWHTSKEHWVFASYVWNASQTDAELAAEDGVANIAEIVDGKRHSIPSINECRACHDSNRTETLGFDALQLSTDRDPNALHAEPLSADMLTLRTLVDDNLITPPRPDLVTNPPRIDASSPQTRAALGYLSTNCGSCHNSTGSIASLGLDLKQSTSSADCNPALASTVGQRGHWVVPEAQDESRLINPGHPESSAVVRRVRSRRPLSQMPPIGTVVVDREAVDMLTAWIQTNPGEFKEMLARCSAS